MTPQRPNARRSLLWPLLLCGLLLPTLVSAETRYISDVLSVPLRSGPSNSHRILDAGLPSGTALEVLGEDEDSGFTQVRTEDGLEGWIRAQYLVTEPIAKDRLQAAQRRIQNLENTLAQLRQRHEQLQGERAVSQQSNEELNAEVQRLEAELAEIRRISAGAMAQHAENQELTTLNERLREEIGDLIEANQRLEDNLQERWLLIGGGLVLGGLILGLWVSRRSQRSGWG